MKTVLSLKAVVLWLARELTARRRRRSMNGGEGGDPSSGQAVQFWYSLGLPLGSSNRWWPAGHRVTVTYLDGLYWNVQMAGRGFIARAKSTAVGLCEEIPHLFLCSSSVRVNLTCTAWSFPFLIFILFSFVDMYMWYVCVCLCGCVTAGAHRGQNRVLDPWPSAEMKLQTVVDSQAWVLGIKYKSSASARAVCVWP